MARLARVVFQEVAHHVTQRGTGRARTLFSDGDYELYRSLLAENCAAAGVEVWAWVLMPNHVHMILVPADEDGLRRALAPLHHRYAGHVHAREKRSGHFWQGRFGCVAMDDAHLAAALVHVALNPVRARLVERATDWRWSSLHAHLDPAAGDGLTATAPVLERFAGLATRIAAGEDPARSLRADSSPRRRAGERCAPTSQYTCRQASRSRLSRSAIVFSPGASDRVPSLVRIFHASSRASSLE